MRVVSGDGREQGTIQAGLPGLTYSMRRDDARIWGLSVRSLLRKRHALALASGETWGFDTPFFWWQHLTGTTGSIPSLIGKVGPNKAIWVMSIEPGKDSLDVLAACAYLQRIWWRW
jgi:hypothetical protein